jgi:hypothetical protein
MTKQGGVSWSSSAKHKQGIQSRHKCKYCNRQYKQEWSKDRHEKNCKEIKDKQDKQDKQNQNGRG